MVTVGLTPIRVSWRLWILPWGVRLRDGYAFGWGRLCIVVRGVGIPSPGPAVTSDAERMRRWFKLGMQSARDHSEGCDPRNRAGHLLFVIRRVERRDVEHHPV